MLVLRPADVETVGILEDAPDCASGASSCRVFTAVNSFLRPDPEKWPVMMSAYFEYHAARDWPGAALVFENCPSADAMASDYIVFFVSRGDPGETCLGHWTRLLRLRPPAFERSFESLATIDLPSG